MLPLDDPSWSALDHAFGQARDTPRLLAQLAERPSARSDRNAEPWFSLWSSLCHQGDVYAASYAALPHIVRIGTNALGPIPFDFLLLPASIELARLYGRGPLVPATLVGAYRKGVAELLHCVWTHRDDPWDQDMALSVAAAVAVAKGQVTLARALVNLDDEQIRMLGGE